MNQIDIPLPPHSIEAEQSIIGSLLLDNLAFDRIVGMVNENDFYREDHRLIWRHIVRIIGDNNPADVVTVAASMENDGTLDEAGGLAYLAALALNTPSSANIRKYAEIVREKWQARKLLSASWEIADLATSQDIKSAIGQAQAKLSEIAETRTASDPRPISDALPEFLKLVESAHESEQGFVGLPTHLKPLDKKLGGLKPGQLIILAGRPAMGKTSLAMQIAHDIAANTCPVLVLSMEMSSTELVSREVSRIGKLPLEEVISGRLYEEDWDRLTYAISRINSLPLIVDEQGGLSISEVRAKARTASRKHGIGLVVVDYLQLMRGEVGTDNRNEQVSQMTRGLKALAKELQLPVICLSQLSRDCEKRSDKRPMPSDLRDSGSIEQDADVILFVYRDEVYHAESHMKGIAEIIIGKQRNGPTGTVYSVFIGERTEFAEMSGPIPTPEPDLAPRRRGM